MVATPEETPDGFCQNSPKIASLNFTIFGGTFPWSSEGRLPAYPGNDLQNRDPNNTSVFGPYIDELRYSVDILAEHQLAPRLREFPLVVIPDSHKLADEFKGELQTYVEGGGSLLLLGEKCARMFEPSLGTTLKGKPRAIEAELATPAGPVNIKGEWQDVALKGARPAGFRHPTRDTRRDGAIAASIAELGRGKIAAAYGPLANIYFRNHHPWLREYIGVLVKELFPKPAVTVEGPAYVDISFRKTSDGKLSLHLLNRTNLPMPDRYNFTDFIPAIGPLEITLACPARPNTVTLVPEGTALECAWADGRLRVVVPRFEIHSVVVIN